MTSPEFAAFVGIDWGDQKHAVCLVADGVESERELPHRAAEIDTWANELRTRFNGRLVAVCLEQSRGPLIYALLKYEFFVLFPVNPKQATRYREALYPSGSKDDPVDARLLCRFLINHHHQLRAWCPDDEATRLLRILSEDRKRYSAAEDLQQLSGIAPVLIRSGKSCTVRRRSACPKFLRQTFHEYADHSRKTSIWAGAYYQMLRDRGMRHHAALRSLAFKWQRILFRCWQSRASYNEVAHLQQLRLNRSPLLQYLAAPQSPEPT